MIYTKKNIMRIKQLPILAIVIIYCCVSSCTKMEKDYEFNPKPYVKPPPPPPPPPPDREQRVITTDPYRAEPNFNYTITSETFGTVDTYARKVSMTISPLDGNMVFRTYDK